MVAVSQLAIACAMKSDRFDLCGRQQAGDHALNGGVDPFARSRVGLEHGTEVAQRAFDIVNGSAGRFRGVGFQCQPQPCPNIPQPRLHRLVRDDAADGSPQFGRARGVLLEPRDLAPHPFVECGAQFGPVRAHLVEFPVDGRQHTAGNRGAQRPADKAAALLANAFLDRRADAFLFAGKQCPKLAQDEAEHLLMAAAFDKAVQRTGDNPACTRTAEDPRHDPRDQPASAAILHAGKDPRQHACQCNGCRPRGGRIGKEAMQDTRQIKARQHTRDLIRGEHVGGDETAERGAQPLLLVGDDRGVRDR